MSPALSDIRKIIKIGERSVGVTIPKEWLPLLGVSVGTTVEVSLGAGFIMIKPVSSTRTRPTIGVRVSGRDVETLSRLLIAGYIEGYDSVIVDSERDLARRAFYSVAMRLPGAIAMDGEAFTVKISVDEMNTNIDEVVSSMRTIINNMFDLLMDYFQTGDKSRLEQLIRLDDDLDRLHFLGVRTIKRTSYRNPQEALDNMIVIKSLEHIGDALDRASNTLLKLSSGLSKECVGVFREIFASVASYTSKAINAFLTLNLDLATKVLLERHKLHNEIFRRVEKCTSIPETLALAHEATVMVFEAAEIAEVATAKLIRKQEKELKMEKGS